MNTSNKLSRRTLLRGLGISIALPWLEAMGPMAAWADSLTRALDPQTPPNRMAFVYVPNGKNMVDWTPKKVGANFDLPAILKPLEKVKDKTLMLSGLTADKARANGDGGGDHARAMAAFLTGVQPRKTDGTNIRAGISVDQVAASNIGAQTRLPSLEIGTERGKMAGNCDSGYSCVYSSTVSWRSATQPLPTEIHPKLAFERLFSSLPDSQSAQRDNARKSILDFVRQDSKELVHQLGQKDVRKLDEYFSAIRDIELRIERAEKFPPIETPDYTVSEDIPSDYQVHLRLMADLIVLAFQADVTRVVTFAMANEGSNKPYPFIDVPEGHHNLSHHRNDEKKIAKIRQINIFHTQQLAYLLEKLDATPEGDGSLLDHSMIVYGSGNADGNRHSHHDLPILLAGGGCGTIKSGRHIRYPDETPLNNLWLSMLNRMDIELAQLGDSTGCLPGLS
jgi:hypothetical protein